MKQSAHLLCINPKCGQIYPIVSRQIKEQYKNTLDTITKKEILDQLDKFKDIQIPENLVQQETELLKHGMKKEEIFKAKLINNYSKRKDFTHFARCLINVNSKGLTELRVLSEQQSHRIKSFAKANCWGIFPSGKNQFKSGDIIEWVPLIPSS